MPECKRAAVAEAPESSIAPVLATPTMSRRIWGLDWSHELPWQFEDVTVERGTFEDALPFMQEHYAGIFGVEPDRFLVEGMTEAKHRFWREMDVFVFRCGGRAIGICAGHPTDWSTYYVRTFAILPEYRERRFATSFAKHLDEALVAAGVTRVEAECSPANTAMVRVLTSDGYLVTSTVNSERWGSMLRFTKFLAEDAAKAFRRQFIYAPSFGRNAQPKNEGRTP